MFLMLVFTLLLLLFYHLDAQNYKMFLCAYNIKKCYKLLLPFKIALKRQYYIK